MDRRSLAGLLGAAFASASLAHAQSCFLDRTTWLSQGAGPVAATQDFSGYHLDLFLSSGPLPFVIGDLQSLNDPSHLNRLDAPPLQLGRPSNGTTHIACTVGPVPFTGAVTHVQMDLAAPASGWGGLISGGATSVSAIELRFLGGGVVLGSCTVPQGLPDQFVGFHAAPGATIDRVEFRQIASVFGQHPFGLDDIEVIGAPPASTMVFCECTSPPPGSCATTGSPGHGCANGRFASGAVLASTGTPSLVADSLRLESWNLPTSTFGIVVQSPLTSLPVVVGDGLLCLGGPIVRLGPPFQASAAGFGSYSGVAQASALVGFPIPPGATRGYQVWYRDGASSCGSGFNFTNGLRVTWTAAPPASMADHGDAPDDRPTAYATPGASQLGRFPTLASSSNARLGGRTGPRHTNPNPSVRLGAGITLEADALQIDADADDARALLAVGAGSAGRLHFDLAARASATVPVMTAYVNVLIDLDRSGHWFSGGATDEWVVRNLPVTVASGSTARVQSPSFALGATGATGDLWARLTVTASPIDAALFVGVGGWDGSGPAAGFLDGETEDLYLPPAVQSSLRITVPDTTDAFPDRLMATGDWIWYPLSIEIENLAGVPRSYDIEAVAEVARPLPFGGWIYEPVLSEYELELSEAGGCPPFGGCMAPDTIELGGPNPHIGGSIVTLDRAGTPAARVVLDLSATVDRAAAVAGNAVVDDTTHPSGHQDNILGRFTLYPISPCVVHFDQVGRQPVFMHWPFL